MKAIQNDQLLGFLGLTVEVVRKYISGSIVTIKAIYTESQKIYNQPPNLAKNWKKYSTKHWI